MGGALMYTWLYVGFILLANWLAARWIVPLILVNGRALRGFDPGRLLRALRQAGADV